MNLRGERGEDEFNISIRGIRRVEYSLYFYITNFCS